MPNRSLYKSLFLLLLAAAGISGCHKLLDVPVPAGRTDAAALYADDASTRTAMSGIYNEAMDNAGGLLNGDIGLYTGLSADELACTYPAVYEDSFYLNRLTASNSLNSALFSSGYTLIYELNSLLSGLDHSQGVTAATKAELQGEARFLRALLYFYLVNLYGGVPLVTGTDYIVNARLPRVEPDSLYAQMIRDLQGAQQSLPVDYLAAAGYTGDRTRPVQATATALLARVYLYLGQWAQAEQAAGVSIGDARYRLEPSLDSVFLSTSREAIWQLQPVHDSLATADAHFYLPLRVGPFQVPSYYLTPQLLGSVEGGDQRRVHWTDSVRVGVKIYVYPYKYKEAGYRPGHAEYEMVLRLAEQYLIRAEARARQGNLAGAIADLDMVRERAGLPASTAASQGAVIDAIMAERRVELLTEWGQRWFDLKRTGQADAVLGTKAGWRSADALYPIPGYELIGNPNVGQNPGY